MRKLTYVINIGFLLGLGTLASACGGVAEEDLAIGEAQQALMPSDAVPGKSWTHSDGNRRFMLDKNRNGIPDDAITQFDINGSVPIVGSWTLGYSPCNAETTKIGTFRTSTRQFFLDNNGDGIWNSGDRTVNAVGLLANPFYTVVPFSWRKVGQGSNNCDWIVGLYIFPANGGGTATWWLNWDDDGILGETSHDRSFSFGDHTQRPAPIRHPNGTGTIAATWKASTAEWFIDWNSNNVWNGCTTDRCVTGYGQVNSGAVTNASRPFIGTRFGNEVFIDRDVNFGWDGEPADLIHRYHATGETPFHGTW